MTTRRTPICALLALCLGAMNVNAQNPTPGKQNAREASEAIQKHDYTQKRAYIVADAHLDTQWNWTIRNSITGHLPKTLYRNFFLLENYPDYIFNFEGGVKYAWMKEYYPELYGRVVDYVKEGRWHISGASWDANDPNMPSPESMVRNILYGQHLFEKEFGVLSTDIFLPDCFGFSWTVPTIAAHSGLIGFSTQKLEWRNNPFYEGGKKVPFELGLWEGIDGSRIMMAPDGHGYGTNWKLHDLSSDETLLRYTGLTPLNMVFHYYGTGDTGGAPDIESVRTLEKGISGNGPLKIISATSDQLFKDFLPYESHPELPVWKSELLMDVHATGCYTSQAAMKLFNRRNEQLADAAERSAVAADWLGKTAYPQNTLTEAWKRMLFHQFHDDLTGTSIPEAYELSWNDELISLNQFRDVLNTSVGAVSSELDTKVSGTPLVVYNPSGFARKEVIEVNVNGLGQKVAVFNPEGKAVAAQKREGGKLAFVAEVPAVGYAVYSLRSGAPKSGAGVKVSGNVIENSVYKLSLDANGDIASIIDKRCGRELVKEGKSIRLALFTHNASYNWPAWEIIKETMDAEPVAISSDVKISTSAQGPVMGALKVERSYGESRFCQEIRLYEGADADRIDIVNDFEWATMDALLKAEFPLSVSNPKARYDLGIGSIERGNNVINQYEVPAQQWADLTDEDGSYGVSILNDCKYGWDKPADDLIRLTLLHTPQTKNAYKYQDHQDLGKHVFTYSIIGHSGDYRNGGTVRKAEALNQPLKAFTTTRHSGKLGRRFSFASVDNQSVELRAIKMAEDSDAYVVRFYETAGQGSQKAVAAFAADIIEAKELDGNEKVKGDAAASGKQLSFEIGPFGIKTFLVKLAKADASEQGVICQPLELEFNVKAASFNAFRAEGNFDGEGNTYAAELLPESLNYQGIEFKLGDPVAENALNCGGQTIQLPEGKWNKVYLLAAANNEDVSAVFSAGGKEQQKYIPYYGGFVGQWGHTGHTEGFRKDAAVAYVGTHKHNMKTNTDLAYDFSYMFNICIDVPEGASEITLPVNRHVVIFAATAAYDRINTVTERTDNLRISVEAAEEPEVQPYIASLISEKHIIGFSKEFNSMEAARCAVDDNPTTKWCDATKEPNKFIDFDMGEKKTISSWYVLHAAMESPNYITKSFALQVKDSLDEEWRTIDQVNDNTAAETRRKLQQPVDARYVRFLVLEGDQVEVDTARIYEIALY